MYGARSTAHRRPFRRLPAVLALGALFVVPLTACDSILEVEDPDVVKPPQLEGADAIPTLIAGAVLDFQIAFNGNFNNALVVAQGLFTDEYVHSETFEDRRAVDTRSIDRNDNQIIQRLYGGLHVARASATEAAAHIEEFEPDNDNLSFMHTLHGYAEVFLAESFCSGVPISRTEGSALVFGEPRSTSQELEDAIAAFDQALSADASSDLAKVGKARALLDLGRFDEAAATAADVSTSFIAYVYHSSTTTSQNNALWSLNDNGRLSVAEREGDEGLPFRSALDPRVPWMDSGTTGFDEETPLYLELVQPEIDSDVVLASGVEARLIEAEAALQAGDRGGFFDLHNQARATAGLPDLTDSGQSATELANLHFRERAFWFYSTAHRLGDLRRLIRQYGREATGVFPSGDYFKGGSYGDDLNFPIPVEEDNNPNTAPLTQGCLDRNA
ncbi:MAG: tetratricopeptide repeat protein [Longimicrobiales bacterium]